MTADALTDQLRRLSAQTDQDRAAADAVRRAVRATGRAHAGRAWIDVPAAGSEWVELRPFGTGLELTVLDVAGYPGAAGGLVALFALRVMAAATGSPGDILAAANRAVVGLKLSEPALVSGLVLRIDGETGEVSFARAAVPPPVCGEVVWNVAGPLIGVFAADYPTRTERLTPGDCVRVGEIVIGWEGEPGA